MELLNYCGGVNAVITQRESALFLIWRLTIFFFFFFWNDDALSKLPQKFNETFHTRASALAIT